MRAVRHPSRTLLALVLLPLTLAACGDSSTDPESRYDEIGGSYAGSMAGVSEGVLLEADFTLTIAQTAGNLGGTFALTGVLDDGFDQVSILGTGTLGGSIAAGTNPSVNFTLLPASCPNRPAQFSGSYDSTNRRLTLAGPVQIFDLQCGVFLNYQATIVLTR
jgi:hypothetical protein